MTPKTINISYTAEDGTTHSREYTDLSQVWHPASEEPQGDSEILFDGLAYAIIYDLEAFLDKLEIDWEELVEGHYIQRWAYIKDLLPKGGER